ncbi:ribonuclease Z, partial [bacterium]|nr:ribonuclease Z [bacterium]
MIPSLPFYYFDPVFFAGLLEDPVLLIRTRSAECNILVDCGQIDHLAKRVIKSVGSLFISHA